MFIPQRLFGAIDPNFAKEVSVLVAESLGALHDLHSNNARPHYTRIGFRSRRLNQTVAGPIEFFSLPTADGEIPANRATSRRDLPVARNVLAFSNLGTGIGGRPNRTCKFRAAACPCRIRARRL